MDDPNTKLPEFTTWGVYLFVMTMADGLLDAEEKGFLHPSLWLDELESWALPQLSPNPQLTDDDRTTYETLFKVIRAALDTRRR